MSIVAVDKNNFRNEVLLSDRPVLLYFWAPWCGACKTVSPIVDEIASEYTEFKVCKVDTDREQELTTQFEIMSIPTIYVIKDGAVVNHSVGQKTKTQILEMLIAT